MHQRMTMCVCVCARLKWSHCTKKKEGNSYLTLAVQFLEKPRGVYFRMLFKCPLILKKVQLIVRLRIKILTTLKQTMKWNRELYLPSSSDTSKISSTVSGKLMRCFSVVVLKENVYYDKVYFIAAVVSD